jgi:hypothetical protein
MKDPEFKKLMGQRRLNNDGFTYVYGAAKDGSKTNRSANRASTKREIRNGELPSTRGRGLPGSMTVACTQQRLASEVL